MSGRAKRRKAARKASNADGVEERTRTPLSDVEPPSWLPWVVYPLLTAVLFREFVFSDAMLFGHDTLELGYMARAFFAERMAAGDFPLWMPSLLGGIPLVESLGAGDSIYPTSLLYFIMAPHRALGWKLVLHVLAAGFFMYGWARALGLGRLAALVAGTAWLLAPVIVTLVLPGNDGKLMVASLAPLVFWAAHRVLVAPGSGTVAALALAVGVTSLTTQFQTAYFLFLSVGAYAFVQCIALARGRREIEAEASPWVRGQRVPFRLAAVVFGLFLGGSLLGGALASVQLVPAAQYVKDASRRTRTTTDATPAQALAYSNSYAFHPEEALSLVVPQFVGNTDADVAWGRNTHWGRNGFKINHEYLGVSVLLLGVLAVFHRPRKRRERWFFFGLGTVAFLYSLGMHTPVWRIFYEVVPGFSLFRVPALSAFLFAFAATTLMAFGVDDALRSEEEGSFWSSARGKAGLGFVGLLAVGFLLHASGGLTALWTSVVYPTMSEPQLARLLSLGPAISKGFLLAIVFSVAVLGLVWVMAERRLASVAFTASLAAVICVDLMLVDGPFIRTIPFDAWAAPDANARALLERQTEDPLFRVANFGDAQDVTLAMHGLDLVAGHHPNDLSRYRDLLGLEGSERSAANLDNPNVLRMLATRYFVWPETQAGGAPYSGATPISQAQGRAGIEAVYEYPGLDRGWIVHGSEVISDDEAALARVLDRDFDPAGTVVLSSEAGGGSGPGGPSIDGEGVVWERFDPDHRVASVALASPGFLVISENWFPGWEATVDGVASEVLRANYTLQAVPLEAGTHSVELRFVAPTVRPWFMVSLAALAIIAGLWVWSRPRGSVESASS